MIRAEGIYLRERRSDVESRRLLRGPVEARSETGPLPARVRRTRLILEAHRTAGPSAPPNAHRRSLSGSVGRRRRARSGSSLARTGRLGHIALRLHRSNIRAFADSAFAAAGKVPRTGPRARPPSLPEPKDIPRYYYTTRRFSVALALLLPFCAIERFRTASASRRTTLRAPTPAASHGDLQPHQVLRNPLGREVPQPARPQVLLVCRDGERGPPARAAAGPALCTRRVKSPHGRFRFRGPSGLEASSLRERRGSRASLLKPSQPLTPRMRVARIPPNVIANES